MKAKTLADMLLTQRKEAREEMNLRTVSLAGMLLTQRKEGRSEVVEWMQNEFCWWENQTGEVLIMPDVVLKWQAQLKVWGIE